VNRIARELQGETDDSDTRALLGRFIEAHVTMGQRYRQGLEAFKAAGFAHEKGDNAVKGIDRDPAKLLREAADTIAKRAAAAGISATDAGKRAMAFSVSAMALVALAGMGAGLLVSRSVIRLLGGEPADATQVAQAIAGGDLTSRFQVRDGDERSLMAALARMQASLVHLVADVRENAEAVATASAQIAQGNSDLSSRTEEQASALQQTASSMEQLDETVKRNSEAAVQASQLAIGASSVASRGGEVVGRVVETMKAIDASAKKIAEINGVIDSIAFQTNILALNAAVEAARAGEQGRGFAVVASEVRGLASRSADAAKDIKALIAASVQSVEQGTALVNHAGSTMQEIVSAVQRVADITGEISAATTEQGAGMSQVGTAVVQIDQATQQNAALVEEAAAATASLKSQAERLVQAVASFRIETGLRAA